MDGYDVLVFEQNRLTELKSRLFAHERAMKDERRKLWQSEKESEEECQVWSELELLSTYIYGYVSQINLKPFVVEEICQKYLDTKPSFGLMEAGYHNHSFAIEIPVGAKIISKP